MSLPRRPRERRPVMGLFVALRPLPHDDAPERNALMSNPFVFQTGTASHVGQVRKLNEDDLLVREEIGLWVVVDGMGGHGGGDLASGAVVAALKEIGALGSASEFLAQFE